MADKQDSQPDTHDRVTELLEFVSDRDAWCPLCGYNVRALTEARCPECGQELVLTVGVRDLSIIWLIVTLVPTMFSGIAAALLSVPMIVTLIMTPAMSAPWGFYVLVSFGWASGIFGILLVRRRYAFLRQPHKKQKAQALVTWSIHILAFFAFLIAVFP
ncbi:MAG: hypothetical protein JXO22_02385 [Phycisphaerae bacterium]|nr:hypothetical protein [Phycisphaerae bacterium]